MIEPAVAYTCARCRRPQPPDQFASWTQQGKVRRDSYCRACRRRLHQQRYERQHGPRKRPPKVNDHGDVRCALCALYVPADRFYRRPDGRYVAYCRDCDRSLGRMEYAVLSQNPEWVAAERERDRMRYAEGRGKVLREQRDADRRFIQGAVRTLRCRGLGVGDIGAAIDQSPGRVTQLGQHGRGSLAVGHRLAELVRLTSEWPMAPEPGRVAGPHPMRQALVDAMAPTRERFPIRYTKQGG